jgi:ATP-dependent DNA helicase PIF1
MFGGSIKPVDSENMAPRAILRPRNDDVDQINDQVLELLEGERTTYLSSDSIEDVTEDDRNNYPLEFLNSLTPSVMPPYKLKLKKGALNALKKFEY